MCVCVCYLYFNKKTVYSTYLLLLLQAQNEIDKMLNRLSGDELFCDPDFPAEPESIYYSQSTDYKWLRPKVC